LSSFGGGEVYLGISEVVFVQTGFIPEFNYSTQILGIANSMPGPVICAVVTGVGFTYGNINHGLFFGWVFGLLGWAWTISTTALGALGLYICYDFIKDKSRVRLIIRYIMPVVCGLLITTALSLLRQASMVFIDINVNRFISSGIVIAIFILITFLHRKFKLNDIALLAIGGIGTLSGLGIFNRFF
jgi:chromate transporter